MRKFTPLICANFLCNAAMMSFIVIIGPLIRILKLDEWHGGLMMTIAGLTWMLLSRPWGLASDRLGRKKVLLLAITGVMFAYFALAVFLELALSVHLPVFVIVVVMMLLRGGIGAFYAAIPVTSTAMLADQVPKERRTAAMAMIGAANALGMIFGPLLAGLLVSRGMMYPIYFSVFLPLLALLIAWRVQQEPPRVQEGNLSRLQLSDKRLRLPLLTSLIAMSCVLAAQVLVGFYAIDKLQLDYTAAAQVAGYAMTAVGMTLVVVQAFLMKSSKRSAESLLTLGSLISAGGFVVVCLVYSISGLIIGYAIISAGLGLIFPSMQAITANSVRAHEQGAAAGVVSSAQGLAMILAPVIATSLYRINTTSSYWLCCLLLLLLAALAYRLKVSNLPRKQEELIIPE